MQLSQYTASYKMSVCLFIIFNDVSSTDDSSLCQLLTLNNKKY